MSERLCEFFLLFAALSDLKSIFHILFLGLAQLLMLEVWGKSTLAKDSTQYFRNKKDFVGLRDYAKRQINRFEKKGRNTWPELAGSFQHLGDAYRRLGQLDSARNAYFRSLEIKKLCYPKVQHQMATTFMSLGTLEMRAAQFYEAESYLKLALEKAQTDPETSQKFVAPIWYHLGTTYVRLGQFEQAKSAYLTSLAMAQATDSLQADIWNGLGTLFLDWGQYPQADSCYSLVLNSLQARHGPNSPALLYPTINLGNLNFRLGRYERSEQYFLKAQELIQQNNFSPAEDKADLFNNLGVLYLQTGELTKAANYLEKALEIKQKLPQGLDLEAAATILNLGNIHFRLGRFIRAQQFFEQAKDAYLKKLEPNHPDMADIYANLGAVYMNTHQWPAADSVYQKSFFISKQALGDLHPRTIDAAHQLAVFYWCSGKTQAALSHFIFYHKQVLRYISRYFPHFTEDQKEKFAEKLQLNEESFKSFCASNADAFPFLKEVLLEHELAMKGLLFDYGKAWRSQFHAQSDSASLPGLYRWKVLQDSIYLLVTGFGSEKINQIDALIEESELLEKNWQNAFFSKSNLENQRSEIKVEQIREALKPGEAAVQIIRYQPFNNLRQETDSSVSPLRTFSVFGKSDSVYYAIIILKPGAKSPELIRLTEGQQLEGRYWNSFYKSIQKLTTDTKAYARFWKPIGTKLQGAKVVYFSGDGIYHKLNPDALFVPENRKYLGEFVQLRRCISLRDLLLLPKNELTQKNQSAVLVGNPNFQSDTSNAKANPSQYAGLFPPKGPTELPGSQQEVDQIAYLLQKHKIPVSLLVADSASEYHLKKLKFPAILHLATHGFFIPNPAGFYNPLYKTGLILSEYGKQMPEDGVLTAYEAMQLPLNNTSLVVLSACETGLGDVKNSEGVLGLQRAFQMAGARTIIMSLWKVSDEVSKRFMTQFYFHWLAGKTKRTAFAIAQADIRKHYPQPYFWAAFSISGD